jgi:predicted restriction endonuclease
VPDVPTLRQLLRRAFRLSKSLPNEFLHTFEEKVVPLPKGTESERLVVQRVDQNLLRDGLLDIWEGRCAVTNLAVPALLRANRIKPWVSCCETDVERLAVYNGILLARHLDAAFDCRFITFRCDGAIIVSESLDAGARSALRLEEPLRVRSITDGYRIYLPWHRQHVCETWETGGTW